MTGATATGVPAAGAPSATADRAARAGFAVLLVVCAAVSVGWLGLGAVVAAAQYWAPVGRAVAEAGASGSPWARAVAEAAPSSEPFSQAVLDFGFSALNLALAVVLLAAGVSTWSVRLLALALVGSAGAFNLQAHAAARAVEVATDLSVSVVHQVVLHGVACAAYILALLVFPTPTWDALPHDRQVRRGLLGAGVVTFLFVGLGTALLPHTVSCVLFFGFLVPAVGLVVLPRRVRRGPGAEARTQARLLFSTLVGGFTVSAVLAVVTVALNLLGGAPSLALVDPTAQRAGPDHLGHAAAGEPIALLFWFSRLASAAVAVVVLLAIRRDKLWTAERWFSRGLAVLLVTAVGGGVFVVLRTGAVDALGALGATAAATATVALGLWPLYTHVERLVDRLLYGTRPAPYRVLADVTALSHSTTSATGAGAPDLDRVAEAVALGLGAAVCRITVRRAGLRDRTYVWADRGAGPDDLLEVPVRHGNEQVGVLAVDRAAVSGLQSQRDQLLTDIADALGVVLQASRSGIELERQLRAALAHAEEIAVSRRRTVAEMDGERRRIERDLHDGAQHHLVSLRLVLGLVEHQLAQGELVGAREWLRKLAAQLADAEAVLAATVDGVSSLVLAERGLVVALRVELAGAHPPITFDDGGIPAGRRFPAEVEAAVWFCCSEAVGNARKHAAGAPVTVRLAERCGAVQDRVLCFAVRDEGPGFVVPDPGDSGGSRGLRNLTARVSRVRGRVTVRSAPGEGTTVEGEVPLPRDAAATVAVPARTPDPAAADTVPHALPAAGAGSAGGPLAAAVPGTVAPPEPAAQARPVAEPAAVRGAGPDTVPPPVPDTVAGLVPPPRPAPDTGTPGEPEAQPEPEPGPAPVGAGRLAAEVRALAHLAADAYRGTPEQERVDELARRIDEPVRVAVLGTVDDDRRMLVEALVGVPAVPDPHRYADPLQGADPGQTADPGRVGHAGQGTGPGSRGDVAVRYAYGARGVAAGPDAVVVTLAAPALRAVTLVDVPLAADGADRVRTLLGPPGPPVADAVVLLLHYGRAADAELLDRLHAAGQRGAIGVLVRGDGTRAAAEDTAQDTAQDAAEDAAAEYAADPQVRRVCEVVTPVSPSTALAAARLGDDEYRALRAAARPADGPGPRGDAHAAPAPPEVPPVLLERLGPTGARRALRLVRSGDGATRAELAAALVAHSGVADLQDLIASRFTGRADVLRTRSVLAGLEGVLRAAPPGGDAGRTLRYQLERVRAGAHELREAELLDLLRSGDLPLPDDALRAAELLLGSDGADVRTRLGLHADATVDEVRAAATRQPARWRELASHPMTSSRVREACRVLVRTCEQLVIEVDDPFAVR